MDSKNSTKTKNSDYLNDEERALYFRLYFAMLAGVNDRHKIVDGFKAEKLQRNMDPQKVLAVKTEVFANPQWIEEYLVRQDKMPRSEREIIASWYKHAVTGRFLVMRNLARYSVLMYAEKGQPDYLYGVVGLNHPFADFYSQSQLPTLIDVTLLPFMGKIIYDGIFTTTRPVIVFGPTMRKELNDEYRESKEKYGIIESLPFDAASVQSRPKPAAKPKPTVTAKEKAGEIEPIIRKYCEDAMDPEFLEPCLNALGKLQRKRPSPLLSGKSSLWAAGIAYAIASNNEAFAKYSPYSMNPQVLAESLGYSKSSLQNKSAEVKKLLGMTPLIEDYMTKGEWQRSAGKRSLQMLGMMLHKTLFGGKLPKH